MLRARKLSVSEAHKTGKAVKLHHHHAKAYRKRHIGLVAISLLGLVLLAWFLVEYRAQIVSGAVSSRDFVAGLFRSDKSYDLTVRSSYGFNLTYDQKSFYAGAIDNSNGNLRIGTELSKKDAYSVVRIASGTIPTDANQTSLTLSHHPEITYTTPAQVSSETLRSVALNDGGLDATNINFLSSEQVTLGGRLFEKSIWQTKQNQGAIGNLDIKFVTYTNIFNNHPITIVVNQGFGNDTQSIYNDVISSLSFGEKLEAVAPQSSEVLARINSSKSILDAILFSDVAAAASIPNPSASERVAAEYGPAVVKIYNAYCINILVDGEPYLNNFCDASMGSGFFVSQDGYLVTNGHVATADAQSAVITEALTRARKGDSRDLNYLLSLSDFKSSDLPSGASATQKIGIAIDKIYSIDSKRFTITNGVQNLLVDLTEEQPDVTTLLDSTDARKEYPGTDTIKRAKVVAYDYRANDGYDSFHASDVAIIKIDGANYPVVKLGSIDLVNQGANLSILGFPGNATNNGIVDSTTSKVTLTTGKVSSKKNAAGSDKQLIETDTTIGHGNSGGPALNDDGYVVGISTYTADGSGNGNGVFSYIRDIKDVKDLAKKESITFDTNSKSQREWLKGLDSFYTAHYSKALKNFAVVQSLNPTNSRVQEFIDAAKTRIQNGEDIKDYSAVIIIIAGVVLLGGVVVGVILIVRHKKKHNAYRAGLAQGTVQPIVPGAPVQSVLVGSPIVTPATSPVAEIPLTPQPVQLTPVAPIQVPDMQIPLPPAQQPQATPPADNPWFSQANTLGGPEDTTPK